MQAVKVCPVVAGSDMHIKPLFSTMMNKYGSTSDGHMGPINVAKHHVVLNPTDAITIHSAPYRADTK